MEGVADTASRAPGSERQRRRAATCRQAVAGSGSELLGELCVDLLTCAHDGVGRKGLVKADEKGGESAFK